MRQIMGAIAQYDKSMIVIKLRGARQRAKTRDGRCEGRKPYGFYEHEASVLEEMKELAQKATPCAVARELNARGRTGRGGKPWHSYVVSRILGAAK